ncbi:hypothetical protein SMC1_08400 [Candidatus Cryosericum septentrionale]|uniref:Uncharacterized protein n=1 Tax=Candidatus Cryosericum septentrionale TaxID=2290913 RepID=A0A398E0G0_9BACT|nr:hypothetical protein SMC1_08400 [Candidatus Cryosericum septentrionale]
MNGHRIAQRMRKSRQARYRQRMEIPQKSVIITRMWAEFDESCKKAFKALAAARERERGARC